MIIDDKQMTIKDDQGNEHLVVIIFTYQHDEIKKKYVFFYEKNNPEEVIAMEYNDEGELLEIESDEEYEEVEEVFNAFNGDEEGEADED